MRYILFTLAFIASNFAAANVSVITTTDSTGKTTHYDPTKWQIVPVGYTKPTIVRSARKCETKIEEKIVEKEVKVETIVFNKNRISVLGGYGPVGLNTVESKVKGRNVYEVAKEFGPMFGFRYDRHLDPEWSISLEYLSNYTGVGGVGYSF